MSMDLPGLKEFYVIITLILNLLIKLSGKE